MTYNFDSTIELTQQQIYSILSPKEIYEKYVGEVVGTNERISCPFHTDARPSMAFYMSGELKYKCFGCGVQGNAVNFVKDLYGISYPAALRKITQDFKLTSSSLQVSITKIEKTIVLHKEQDVVIIPVLRNFCSTDYDYWSQYNIDLSMLVTYDVSACDRVYLYKGGIHKQAMEYSKVDPVYCYKVNDRYKIYRPLNTKGFKWMNTTTSGDVQGMNQLPASGSLVFLTSSLKDVMVLKNLGYNAVALESEGAKITDKLFDYLSATFKKVLIFYDNDVPGLKYAAALSEKLKIGYIHIPVIQPLKDISDYISVHGQEQASQLMLELLDNTTTY